MIAEYFAIIASTLAIIYALDKPLFRPYTWFADEGENASTSEDVRRSIMTFCIFQCMVELVVDLICTLLEPKRLSYKLWPRLIRKTTFVPCFALGAYYGFLLANAAITNADDLSACDGGAMCDCVSNGLLPGGFRENYCLRLSNHSVAPYPP